MNRIESAADRLDAALRRLEGALESYFSRTGDPNSLRAEIDALAGDRARLAAELDSALAREQELQALADEASEALGLAIREVRAALKPEDEDRDG
jgi:uncharacterized protein (DUF3084 family)